MYLDVNESRALAESLQHQEIPSSIECAVFPTFLSFCEVQNILSETNIGVGVQNVAYVPKGAYTGAISALLSAEAGARYAILGHSERRYVFGETDSDIVKKVQACEDVGITPIICIGETQEDLDAGKKTYRLKKQLQSIFEGRTSNCPCIIAYEPVWAISSHHGPSCLPADADDVIGWIKQEIEQFTDEEVPVLYGGNVNEKNAIDFLSIPVIDGILVGSSSTHQDSFSSILAQASNLE